MITFTDKELIKEIKERIGSLDVRDNVERRAYEIALTALTAEPFGIINTSGIALINDGSDAHIWPVNSMEPGDVPLYIGLPRIAPASIPEAMTEEKAYSNVQTSWQDAKYYATGWNACRAAMLQARSFRENKNSSTNNFRKIPEASTSSPVTPDGWISCSELMPAQDDWILIYSKHGEYMAGQVQGEYVELSDGTLSWLGNVLFWMPLPEPPQEVNRG